MRTLALLLAVATVFSSCKSDDPPGDATIFFEISTIRAHPSIQSLSFELSEIALFYNTTPVAPTGEDCGLSGANRIAFDAGIRLDLTSAGTTNVGQFFARPGSLTEVRLLVKRPIAASIGVLRQVHGYECELHLDGGLSEPAQKNSPVSPSDDTSDSRAAQDSESETEHDSEPTEDEFILARLVPDGGTSIQLPTNGIVRLTMELDPVRDVVERTEAPQNSDSPRDSSPSGHSDSGADAEGASTTPSRDDAETELRISAIFPLLGHVLHGNGMTLESTTRVVHDEVVVLFKPGTTANRIDTIFNARGLAVRRSAPDLLYFTVGVPPSEPLVSIVTYLSEQNEIQTVLPNTIPLNRRVPSEWTSSPIDWGVRIGAETAWDSTIGSTKAVVAVVEKGFDLDHKDLFLNVHINKGELPIEFTSVEPDGRKTLDCDGDGTISFYDLNCTGCTVGNPPQSPEALCRAAVNSARSAACARSTTVCIPDETPILPSTLAKSLRDGDSDNNNFADDIVGWDFVDNDNDPSTGTSTDASGNVISEHGMEVIGTIGGIGNNGIGVVGVAWRIGLMPIRADFRDQAILGFNFAARNGAGAINYSQGLVFTAGKFPTSPSGSPLTYNGVPCADSTIVDDQNLGSDRINGKRRAHDDEIRRIPLDKTILIVAPADCPIDLDKTNDVLDWPSQSSNPSVLAAAPSSGQSPIGSFVAIHTPPGPGATLKPGGGSGAALAFESTSYSPPFVSGVAALSLSVFPNVTGPCLREWLVRSGGGLLNAAKAVAGESGGPPVCP